METAKIFKPAYRRIPPVTSKHNNTEDLDDTMPVELLDLDCIDTATQQSLNNWLTRDTPLPGKVITVLHDREARVDSSGFNPPLSSTRYKSDGSSSEYSDDFSTTAECGSAYEDEIVSAASHNNFMPPLVPAPSMDFQPLRCSTAVTSNDLVPLAPQPVQNFHIRVDTCEFKSPKRVQRTESIEFNPLRCSTGLTEVRPKSPEEFYTCAGGFTVQEDESNFVTALGFTQGNSCGGMKQSTEIATSPIVEVTGHPEPKQGGDANDDLSILMQCHLKIRNGRQIISNVQAKPQIEFSVFKNSPEGGTAASEALQSKATPVDGKSKIPSKRPANQNLCQPPATSNGVNCKPIGGDIRTKQEVNVVSQAAIVTKNKLAGPTDFQKSKCSRASSPSSSDGRRSPIDGNGNRIQRAIDFLASANIQRVVSALSTLDSNRSAHLCETLVELDLVNNIYDFLTKMNRSVAHQTACVHATSLLLDLAKYCYSTESTWQNGDKVGLLFNLMSIWVSKDNAIFLNCAAILWVFCQDITRGNVIRHVVTTQPKLLEKISVKLSTKILRPATEAPSLEPSWVNSRALRTFKTPCSAFSGLSNALKKLTPRAR